MNQDDKYSEQYTRLESYRLECEARYVMRMDTHRRMAYFDAVKKCRGQHALQELCTEIVRLSRAQRRSRR